MQNESKIDFSTILAASMHDMKNSLCLLLQSIDTISDKISPDCGTRSELAQFHYEISRVNSNLLQLLALYRESHNALPVNIEEHYLDDIFDELLAKNEIYIQNKKISCQYEVDSELCWYFDQDLISNLLNDILINALRYTNTHIFITATKHHDMLEIKIMDDGDGYPEYMLKAATNSMNPIALANSRTGLGLYFATLIANAHKLNDKMGRIELLNGGKLGGSIFILRIP